jgi:hypothetical protein
MRKDAYTETYRGAYKYTDPTTHVMGVIVVYLIENDVVHFASENGPNHVCSLEAFLTFLTNSFSNGSYLRRI